MIPKFLISEEGRKESREQLTAKCSITIAKLVASVVEHIIHGIVSPTVETDEGVAEGGYTKRAFAAPGDFCARYFVGVAVNGVIC